MPPTQAGQGDMGWPSMPAAWPVTETEPLGKSLTSTRGQGTVIDCVARPLSDLTSAPGERLAGANAQRAEGQQLCY
jgi:hypothetical protein